MFGTELQQAKSSLSLMRQGAPDDGSVTAVSFLICQITLWHVPSQDAGNLFICAEEKGNGGQLASTVTQLHDKRYISVQGSQANERQEKCSFRSDRILQSSSYINHVWGAWHVHIMACCEVRHSSRSSSHLSSCEIEFTQSCAKRYRAQTRVRSIIPAVLFNPIHSSMPALTKLTFEQSKCNRTALLALSPNMRAGLLSQRPQTFPPTSPWWERERERENLILSGETGGFIWLAVRYNAALSILICST